MTTEQDAAATPDNPLFAPGLPPFDRIRPEHALPAIRQRLADNRRRLEAIVAAAGPAPGWDSLIAPLEEIGDALECTWAPVSHLNGVTNTPEWRAAYEAVLPELTRYSTEVGQNRALYEAYAALAATPAFAGLPAPRRRSIEHALRDFRLSGVALEGEARERYGALRQRLAELGTRFANNVLDATQGWTRHLDQAPAGAPESVLETWRAAAAERDLPGYVITLDIPSYLPAMQYCEDRELRRELYQAYTSRASECGPNAGQWDNGPLMTEILALRAELAALLGYDDYAGLSLATKMAESPAQVEAFLVDLSRRARPQALREYAELEAFAREQDAAGLTDGLAAWDIPYYSEKLRLARYALSQEELRPYFPAPRVVEGLFAVAGRLFGVSFEAVADVPVWHPDVRYYRVLREGEEVAGFYLDLYARSGKRGGAWMADCRVRRRRADGSLQLPVAFLTCNFGPPTAERPSLLTHDEVTTLFHEFGHGLHHMLTAMDVAAVSGINGVPWDAVELPSQFLENWCWQEEAIALMSGHYRSGEPLPAELLQRMLAARNFQSAMQMQRQIEFSLFDLRLHHAAPAADVVAIQSLLDAVRAEVAVYALPRENRFQHSFSHIFAGGYAAGYYSYKWAEVLSADAFSAFEEEGVFNPETGQRFRATVLESGGGEDPMVLFEAFRGRPPQVDALLRHSGVTA